MKNTARSCDVTREFTAKPAIDNVVNVVGGIINGPNSVFLNCSGHRFFFFFYGLMDSNFFSAHFALVKSIICVGHVVFC